MLADIQHTDFDELRAFRKLSDPEKLERIWLNGRETNGHVADALKDIAEMKPRLATLEKWQIRLAGAVAVVVALAPFVFAYLTGK